MDKLKSILLGQLLAAFLFQTGCVPALNGPEGVARTEPQGPPSAYSISPTVGPRKGGFLIRILGANFSERAVITVGGKPCESSKIEGGVAFCRVQGADQGAENARSADLVITNPNGESTTFPNAIELTKNPEEVEEDFRVRQEELKQRAAAIEAEKQRKLVEIEQRFARLTEEAKKKQLAALAAEREAERLRVERDRAAQAALVAEKEELRLVGLEQERSERELEQERDRLAGVRNGFEAEQRRLERLEGEIQARQTETGRSHHASVVDAFHCALRMAELAQQRAELDREVGAYREQLASRSPVDLVRADELMAANRVEGAALGELAAQLTEAERLRDERARIAQEATDDRVLLEGRVGRLRQEYAALESPRDALEARVQVLTGEIDAHQAELDRLLSEEAQGTALRRQLELQHQSEEDIRAERERRAEQRAATEEGVNGPPYVRYAATSCDALAENLALTPVQMSLLRDNQEDADRLLVASCSKLKMKIEGGLQTNLGNLEFYHREALAEMRRVQRTHRENRAAGGSGTILVGDKRYQVNPDFLTQADPYFYRWNQEWGVEVGLRLYAAGPEGADQAFSEFGERLLSQMASPGSGYSAEQVARLRGTLGELSRNIPLRLRLLHASPVARFYNVAVDQVLAGLGPFDSPSMDELENRILLLQMQRRTPPTSFGDFISRNLMAYKEVFLGRYAQIYDDVEGVERKARRAVPVALRCIMALSFGLHHPLEDMANPGDFPYLNPTAGPDAWRSEFLSPERVARALLEGEQIRGVHFKPLTPRRMIWLLRMATETEFRRGIDEWYAELIAAKPYLTKLPLRFILEQTAPGTKFTEANPGFSETIRRDLGRPVNTVYFDHPTPEVRIPTEQFWAEMLIHYGYLVEVRGD